MRLLGALRIFKRLRELETGTTNLETQMVAALDDVVNLNVKAVQDDVDAHRRATDVHFTAITGLAKMAKDDREAERPMRRAINRRLAALEHVSERTETCGRCGGTLDVSVRFEHGPRLMEYGVDGSKQRAIICDNCQPYAKRIGWRMAMAAPPAAKEPPKTEEVAQ